MGIEQSSPKDCQTSEEAYEIARRFEGFGDSELGSTGDEFTIGSSFSAYFHYKTAAEYYKRGDELKKEGK